jgi:tRNA threonylcarbamoyladenosine biosynthesis protein TsaE
MPRQLEVPTGAQMRALGQRLAGLLRPGDLVVLAGPLGAGKTTLVQGIGEGLGVRGPVTSPTFVIARVHPSLRGGPALVHADAVPLIKSLP